MAEERQKDEALDPYERDPVAFRFRQILDRRPEEDIAGCVVCGEPLRPGEGAVCQRCVERDIRLTQQEAWRE